MVDDLVKRVRLSVYRYNISYRYLGLACNEMKLHIVVLGFVSTLKQRLSVHIGIFLFFG
jgi:hypothetical protein